MKLPKPINWLIASPLLGISLLMLLGSALFSPSIFTKLRQHFTAAGVDAYVASELKKKLADDAKVTDQAVVFLGDSITHDLATESVIDNSVNYGIGGMTSAQLLSALPAYQSLYRAKAIVLMIGINDWGHGISEGLMDRLKVIESTLPSGKPLVWNSIMPAGGNPSRMDEIAATNELIRTLCSSRPSCIYVDTWKFLASPDGKRLDNFYADSLHLNGDGYQLWISALRQAMQLGKISLTRPEVPAKHP